MDRRNILLMAVSIVAAVAIVGGGLAFFQWRTAMRQPMVGLDTNWSLVQRFDWGRFWRGRENVQEVELASGLGRYRYRVTTNAHGLRSPEIAPKGSRFRILVLGDSTVFGYGVENSQAWPMALQALMDGAGDSVEVINAGVVGYSAFQSHHYLVNEGLALEPDLVIVTAGHNDIATDTLRDLELERGRFRLVFRAIGNRLRGGALEAWPSGLPRIDPPDFRALLEAIHADAAAAGAETAFVVWPSLRAMIDPEMHPSYWDIIREVAAETESTLIDMPPAFGSLMEPLFIDNAHFSARGNELAAAFVAEHIRPLVPQEAGRFPARWAAVHADADCAAVFEREGIRGVRERLSGLEARVLQHHAHYTLSYAFTRLAEMLAAVAGMEAEWDLRRAMLIDPAIATPYFTLDRLLDDEGGLEARAAYWARYAERHPHDGPALYLHAAALAEQGDHEAARAFVERAIAHAPRPRYRALLEQLGGN